MKRLATISFIATAFGVLLGLSLAAQAEETPASPTRAQKPGDPKKTNDEELRVSMSAAAKEYAARCEFQVDTAGAKLALHPEPILHFTNPTVGTVFGDVFVWTDNGRPTVVASWYRWFSPAWGATLEVTSLTEERVTGRAHDARFWNSEKPGLTLSPLADAERPAKTPAARLGQMRRLAGEFVVDLADTRGNADGVQRELRLLKQPIFRYPSPKGKATYLDGALFAFVEGTDPEVYLMLEAVQAKEGATWHFGLARTNGDELRVEFRDTPVWSVPTINDYNDMSKEPYALFKSERVFLEPAATDNKTDLPRLPEIPASP
jgi:hypothetical protein